MLDFVYLRTKMTFSNGYHESLYDILEDAIGFFGRGLMESGCMVIADVNNISMLSSVPKNKIEQINSHGSLSLGFTVLNSELGLSVTFILRSCDHPIEKITTAFNFIVAQNKLLDIPVNYIQDMDMVLNLAESFGKWQSVEVYEERIKLFKNIFNRLPKNFQFFLNCAYTDYKCSLMVKCYTFYGSSQEMIYSARKTRGFFKTAIHGLVEQDPDILSLVACPTLQVAQRYKNKISYPLPSLLSYESAGDMLRSRAFEQLSRLRLGKNSAYVDRLEEELSVIEGNSFSDYFLSVQDLVCKIAEKECVRLGPGRGSAAGSLVAYLLGITKIDPVKYGLLFERFMNRGRVSYPDIDIDIDSDKRNYLVLKIEEEIKRQAGQSVVNNICHVGAYSTIGLRGAFRSLLKQTDVNNNEVFTHLDINQIMSNLPAKEDLFDNALTFIYQLLKNLNDGDREFQSSIPGFRVEDAENVISFLSQYDYGIDIFFKAYQDFRDCSKFYKGITTHASGYIFSKRDLGLELPLKYELKMPTIELSLHDCDSRGYIKFDLLGLSYMTIISRTLDKLKKPKDRLEDFISIRHTTKYQSRVHDEILRDCMFIFQYEKLGRYVSRFIRKLTFGDISLISALNRPGPMQYMGRFAELHSSNSLDLTVVKMCNNNQVVKSILEESRGIIVFQEQVIRIVREIGDFHLYEADSIRKAMGKKNQEEMSFWRGEFIRRVEQNKKCVNPALLFDSIELFAGYAFNKSHAISYGYVTYITALLKATYFNEYICSAYEVAFAESKYITCIEIMTAIIRKYLVPYNSKVKGVKFTYSFYKDSINLSVKKNILDVRLRIVELIGSDEEWFNLRIIKTIIFHRKRSLFSKLLLLGYLDPFLARKGSLLSQDKVFKKLTKREIASKAIDHNIKNHENFIQVLRCSFLDTVEDIGFPIWLNYLQSVISLLTSAKNMDKGFSSGVIDDISQRVDFIFNLKSVRLLFGKRHRKVVKMLSMSKVKVTYLEVLRGASFAQMALMTVVNHVFNSIRVENARKIITRLYVCIKTGAARSTLIGVNGSSIVIDTGVKLYNMVWIYRKERSTEFNSGEDSLKALSEFSSRLIK